MHQVGDQPRLCTDVSIQINIYIHFLLNIHCSVIFSSVVADNQTLTVSGPMLSRLVTPALFEKPVHGTDTISCLSFKQQPVLTGE